MYKEVKHEAGNLNEYNATSGAVSAQASAALCGTLFGLRAIGSTTPAYGDITITTPSSGEIHYRTYFDISQMVVTASTYYRVDLLYMGAGDFYIFAGIKHPSDWTIQWAFQDDDGASVYSNGPSIAQATHYAEVYTKRATSLGATDGIVHVWLDGVEVANGYRTNLKNYTHFGNVSKLQVGLPNGLNAADSGNFYEDEIVVSDNAYYIGEYTHRPFGVMTGFIKS